MPHTGLRMVVPVALVLAAAPAIAGQAIAGSPGTAQMPAPSTTGMSGMAAAHAGSAEAQMQQGMQEMQQQMRDAPMTGDPDHDFVAMMLPHHEGAVSMAKVELQYGKDPALLKLSREIIASQDREIVFMKTWLAKHPGNTASAR